MKIENWILTEKLDKYKYVTGEKIVPYNQSQIIE